MITLLSPQPLPHTRCGPRSLRVTGAKDSPAAPGEGEPEPRAPPPGPPLPPFASRALRRPGSLPLPLPEPQELASACQPSMGPAAQAPTCKRLDPTAHRGLHLPRHPTAAAPGRGLAHRASVRLLRARLPAPPGRSESRGCAHTGHARAARGSWEVGPAACRSLGRGGASEAGRGHTGEAWPGSLGIVVGWTSESRLILSIQVQDSSPFVAS